MQRSKNRGPERFRVSIWATLVLTAMLVLSGCGSTPAGNATQTATGAQPAASEQPAPTAPPAVKEITIGTSSVGSTFYTLSVAMGDVVSKHTDIGASVVSVGGADATLRAIGDGKTEMGMVHTWSLYKAYKGEEPFNSAVDVRSVIWGQESGNCLVARADRGIQSPADLKGKTIVGERPALKSVDEYTYVLLDIYGIPRDQVKVISTAETREAMQAMQQGTVDAVVLPCGLRAPHVVELAESVDAVVLDIPDDKMAELLARTTPGAVKADNPPNTYKGQQGDASIPAYLTVLVAAADLPEDVVYKVTKAIIERQDDLVAAHPTGRAWSLENTMRDVNFAVPFHPGAIKYFKERGVWTDAHEATQKKLLAQ